MAQLHRTGNLRFYQAAQRIIEGDPEERKLATSWRLKESICASLDSLSTALGRSKNEIINEVLDAGLAELCAVLKSSRTDLIKDVVEGEPYAVFDFHSPAEYRFIKEGTGAEQLDLEDAISEAEVNQDKTEESE